MGWGSGIAVSCSVGCRCDLDPALLGLWCRRGAVALIQPLAWEPPYAAGAALEKAKRQIIIIIIIILFRVVNMPLLPTVRFIYFILVFRV